MSRFSTRYHLLSLLLFTGVMLGLDIGCTKASKTVNPSETNSADPQVGSSTTDDVAILGNNPRVTVSLPDSVLEATVGDTLMVPVRMSIADGSRMYTDKEYGDLPFQPTPLKITVGGDKHLQQAGPAIFDAIPVVKPDPFFETDIEYWLGNVLLYIPVLVKGDDSEIYDMAGVTIEFMTCDDKACYPPSTVRLPFVVKTVKD